MKNNTLLFLQTVILAVLTGFLFLKDHPVAACFSMVFLFLTLSVKGD